MVATSPAAGVKSWHPWPRSEKATADNSDFPTRKGGRRKKSVSENRDLGDKGNSPGVLGINRLVRDEVAPGVKKLGAVGGGPLEEGYGGGVEGQVGGERRAQAAVAEILRRSERSAVARKVAMMFRVVEVIVCLVSFSVMAADKTKGWSGDSYNRYREYRFCLAVNIIGFVYYGFQVYDLSLQYGHGEARHLAPSTLPF